jgi:rsbT co-antagonist protein RsbR
MASSRIPDILKKNEKSLLESWLEAQAAASRRPETVRTAEHRQLCANFLGKLQQAAQAGNLTDFEAREWEPVRAILEDASRQRTTQGYSSSETATFVFSFKQPLYQALRADIPDGDALVNELWIVNLLLDKLGLFTVETYQKAREEVIVRQQQDLLELSTPVVELWRNVLALPLIGTLDSARTQIVMENLLQTIVRTGSTVAIIDITGVPTVDTLVAQHLLKTVTAARLMGADCIISGIRPQIAQTIVHLGVDLSGVVTKANLADAFALALQRTGQTVQRVSRLEK